MNTLQQKIESLLFFKNEPVSFSWLAKQLGQRTSDMESILSDMLVFYENRGINMVISDGKVALMTAPISHELIQKITKSSEERELSRQALETLAIILYKKKITKAELDYIRGVNSVFILRNLLIRGLIEKNPNPKDKRSPIYSITHDTMSFLGITKISDLPQYEYFKNKLDLLEREWNIENNEDQTDNNLEE